MGIQVMKKQAIVIGSLMLVSGAILAATDGTEGPVSAGTTVITLSNPNRVLVSGLADIGADISTDWSGPGSNLDTASMNFCIGSNAAVDVDVSFSSANGLAGGLAGSGADVFAVEDAGDNDYVRYSVVFSAGAANGTVDDNTDAAITVAAADVDPIDPACTTPNAGVVISFLDGDLQAADQATYQDTLTVTVTPN